MPSKKLCQKYIISYVILIQKAIPKKTQIRKIIYEFLLPL